MSVTMSARPLKVICRSECQPRRMISPPAAVASNATSRALRPSAAMGRGRFAVSVISFLYLSVGELGRRGYQVRKFTPGVRVRISLPKTTCCCSITATK